MTAIFDESPESPERPEKPTSAERSPKPPRGSRWLRLFLRLGAVFLILVLMLGGVLGWLLWTESGSAFLVNRVSRLLLERTGWQLEIDKLDLELTSGRAQLAGVGLGAPGGPAFLKIEHLSVHADVDRLLAGELLFLEVEAERPLVDLTAPLPPPAKTTAEKTSGPFELPFDLLSFRVHHAAVKGAALESGGWLAAWRVLDLEASGSLVDDALDVDLEQGHVRLERAADGHELDLSAKGQAKGLLLGPWTVENLAIEGEALSGTLSGIVGSSTEQPFSMMFSARLDPSLLLPEMTPGAGLVDAEGQLDLRSGQGRLKARADGFPLSVFEPFVDPQLLRQVVGRANLLDIDADLVLDELGSEGIRGHLQAGLRRDARSIVRLEVEAVPDATREIALDIVANVLPEQPGRRRFTGRLTAESWQQMVEGQLEDGKLELVAPDLVALAGQLSAQWPALSAGLSEVPAGSLEMRATANGALQNPAFAATATWLPAAGGGVGLEAQGQFQGRHELNLELSDLDIARLGLPVALGGLLRGEVELLFTASDSGSLRAKLSASQLAWSGISASEVELSTELDFRLDAAGLPDLEQPVRGDLEVRLGDLAAPEQNLEASQVSLAARLDGVVGLDLVREGVSADLDIEHLEASDTRFDALKLALHSASNSLTIDHFEGLLRPPPAVGLDQLPFSGGGQLDFDPSTSGATAADLLTARVELDAGSASAGAIASVSASLEEGQLTVDFSRLEVPDALIHGSARAVVPLETALEIPGLESVARAIPAARREAGQIVVRFDLVGLDLRGFERWTGDEPPLPDAQGDLSGSLRIDPSAPTAATGELVLDRAQVATSHGLVESLESLVIRVGDHRAELLPTRLQIAERSLAARGEAQLAAGWRFEDPVAELIEDFHVEADGAVEAALLEPFLAGGHAEGAFTISLTAAGDLENPTAQVSVGDAGGAVVSWDRPYVTRFASPSFELRVEGDELVIERASAAWNEGRLEMTGRIGDEIDLRGALEDVRYRLDYGLTVETSGTFHYTNLPSPGRLEAQLKVDRGTLRRQIDAGAELLDALLAPPALETGGGAESPFSQTELALEISTRDGVRVKNNLADLQVTWSPLRVEGTIAQPRILGSLEVEPDGRVYAYGQVIRLDRAALIFSGQPAVPAKLDLQVTTSLEDPALLTPEDQRVLASLAQREDDFSTLDDSARSARVRDNLASGLTTYFGDQLASRLGRALGRTQLRYQPLWIFGEADPEARLVVSRDLSRYVSVGVAFDLRQADEQTYLLEIGRLPRLPSLTGTVFSDDQAQLGATFQQQLTFGKKSENASDDRPRVSEITVSCPRCPQAMDPSPVAIARRALSVRRGKRIEPDAAFDLEVEAAERLRRENFPDPTVDVQLKAAGQGRVNLVVEIEPGPQAEFVFTGEEPPSSRRTTLRSLYRSDYSEQSSLDEIRETTERVWRSRGHPWPEVTVEVEASDEPQPYGKRTVTIHSEPGESFNLASPSFLGVPEDVASELAPRFLSQQSRAELVAGAGGADGRLVEDLRSLGYPWAKVMDRSFELEEKRPVVTIESGPRRHISELRLEGAPSGHEESLRELLGLHQGAPLIGAELAEAAFTLERYLRERGWVEATVRLEVSALPERTTMDATDALVDASVGVILEPGIRQRLAEIDITGAEVTEERWVERLAKVENGVEQGEYLNSSQVSRTRRRLLETRLFERVQVDVETSESGEAVLHLDLSERARYLAAYGLRFEESEGVGGMVDVLDRNAGGRGIGLGLRALWVNTKKSLRLYSQLPRFLNSPLDLELFVEGFDEDDEGLLSEGFQLSAQLTWPLAEKTKLRSYVRYRRADVLDTSLRIADQQTRTEAVPLVGFQILHDVRDDPLDPRSGWFASADISGSEDIVSSDVSYLRLFSQVDYYLPLSARFTLAQGARLGVSGVFAGELARDVRFFGGGARSLRGYASRSLGPQEVLDDGSTRSKGGEALLVVHEELRYNFNSLFQGVLFFDLGNVWENAEDLGEDLLTGGGLGVRYRSPIGMLRLDLGHPFDRREGDESLEVYFGLGQAF